MRLLIAEDNRFYRQFLEATVAAWGYEAVSVSDGLAAWEVLQDKQAPHLALLDWLMPGLSGLELCRKVRALERTRPTYLIMLTAKGEKEDVLTALRNGADDYIPKPFDQEELQARLQVGMRIVGLQARLVERVDALENTLSESQKIEAVGRLAGGIAHDFNNLLTVVTGYSELLLGKLGPGDPSREAVKVIRQAANRGAALTRQLLAFARKQILNPVVLDLNTCVANVGRMLRHVIAVNINVVTQLEPDLHPIEADPGQIEQVLMNLLLNARDALPGGGTITLTTENVDLKEGPGETHRVPAGSYALVSVADNGLGMDEQTKARLFEPFFTTKDVGQGTGLGLATAYGIVRQSGGFIRVTSELKRGSTFRVYLPRARKGQRSTGSEIRVPKAAGRGRGTILLVEDEDRVRVLVNSILTLHGYTVLEASNGEEALEISGAYEGPIDLLLTDVIMPGLSGWETAQRLAESRPGTKVLYISGYTDEPSLCQAGETSAPLLRKPFSPDDLVARVREELARQECLAAR